MRGRMKSLLLYGLVAVFLLSVSGVASAGETASENAVQAEGAAGKFKDVTAGDSNLIYINYLAERGISSGFPDGSYHPAEGLTRAQAATLLAIAAGIEPVKDKPSVFKDVAPTHWAASYIAAAAGYLKGYPDGSFHPDEKLTRAQGISLVLRLSKQADPGVELPALQDMDNNHWAARSVAVGLTAGMVGLTADKTQFLPEEEFSRGDLARALAVLLTTDPDLSQVALAGKLEVKKGPVKVNDQTIDESIELKAGDIIVTSAGAEAQLSYPDGSDLLIKEKSTLQIKETRGRSYIKADGTPGTAVDWLLLDLKKGQMFGALASNPNATGSKKETANNDIKGNLVAGLNGIGLVAAQDKEIPWYQNANMKKVKVKVDMPWGAAAVRGSFWGNTVTDSGCSTSLLEGEAELSSGGQTQTLEPGQSSAVSQANAAPTSPAPMTVAEVNIWVQQVAWIQTAAQEIQANQAAVQTEAVITVTIQQQPNQPAPVTPTVPMAPPPVTPNILVVVNQALVQVQQNVGITNIVQINVTQPGVPPVAPPTTDQVTTPVPGSNNENPNIDSESSSSVTIPDSNLQAAIRTALNKPTGTITKSSMASLTSLDASGRGIADLTGLQYASNLTFLDLTENRISGISQLAGLNKLQEVHLGGNRISDISTANWAGKTALDFLGLASNRIHDISSLNSIASSLTGLDLSYNAIGELGPLSGLANLEYLSLHHNSISSIDEVNWEAMTGLNVLNIGWNPLSSIAPLADAASLKDLRLPDTPVSSIGDLNGLTALEKLDISNTKVADLTALSSLSGLKGLSVYGNDEMNSSANVSKIATLTGLEGLDIGRTGISDLNSVNSVVAGMNNLQHLWAAENNITGLSALHYKTSLVELDVQGNNISSITPLEGLTGLEHLNFNNNQVTDITVLSGLSSLKSLHMGENPITSLSALEGLDLVSLSVHNDNVASSISVISDMTDMEELAIDGLGLSDLNSLLAGMCNLRVLHAGGNRLGNGQLSFLAGFTELKALALQYNNISDINALGAMTWLRDLNLEENSISSIEALANLSELQYLDLNDNLIEDVSPVAELYKLRGLQVGGNRITDISALASLSDSLTSLSLWDNQVGSSISTLAGMRGMEELYIGNMGISNSVFSSLVNNMDRLQILHAMANQISSVSALSNKTGLREIQLQDNEISSISTLSGLKYLNSLNINNNHVHDIGIVSGLHNLRNFHAGHNGITDISPLDELTQMRTLSLYGNSVGDSVYAIETMADLRELYIDDMGLTDLSGLLDPLDQLTVLYASGNRISDTSFLSGKASLQGLDLSDNNISSLSALSGLNRLEYLNIENNDITSVSALSDLSRLGGLDFGGNRITDISPLTNLNNLTFLAMWDNPVEDINTGINVISDMYGMEELHIDNMGTEEEKLNSLDAISNMSKLKSLWAGGNNISDLLVLEGKTGLKDLHLDGNNIDDSDFSVVAGLPNLVALSVEHNAITDISPVASLVNLEGLNFGDNQVTDISDLAALNRMKNLAIFSNPVDDVDYAINVIAGMDDMEELHIDDLGETGAKLSSLSAISGMDNLKALYASGNQLNDSDIDLLAGNQQLKAISLDSTPITSIAALSGLTGLVSLSFKDTDVAEISTVAGLHDLEGLDFGGTQVTDISPIAGLNGLKFLSLWNIPISDFSIIANKSKMEDLCISNTGITDLNTLLANMNSLKALRAQNNSITDISALAGKTCLKLLELQYNQISDISALVANCQNGGLGYGDEVYVSGNNLTTDDWDDVQILINAGVKGDLSGFLN